MAGKKEGVPEMTPIVEGAENAATENATGSENLDNPEPPKKRGRPKGSHNAGKGDAPKKSQARQAQDTVALGRQLVGLHQIAALAFGLPELMIGDADGQILAGGINAVCSEYGLSMSGKTGAAIQLIGAAGMVYIPRMLAIRARMAQEAKNRAEKEPEDIDVVMQGAGNGANFAQN